MMRGKCDLAIRPSPVGSCSRVLVAVFSSKPDDQRILHFISPEQGAFLPAGAFNSAAEARAALPEAGAGIFVIDSDLAATDPVWRKVPALWPQRAGLRVVVQPAMERRSLASGVGISGCLVRPYHRAQCLGTLRLALYHLEQSHPSGVTSQGRPALAESLGPVLSVRENEVLRCLSAGLQYKEIEDRLGMAHSAFRKIQHRVFAKLDAQNRQEAVNNWRQLGGFDICNA